MSRHRETVLASNLAPPKPLTWNEAFDILRRLESKNQIEILLHKLNI
jgi:hypothetical protein